MRRLRALLRRPDLSETLAARIAVEERIKDIFDLVGPPPGWTPQDAVLEQDMRWIEDQAAGRPSTV